MTCGLAYAGVFARQPPALETRRLPTNTPTKSASLEGCPNSHFIQSTWALKRTFCKLPGSSIGLQTSPDFTDLIIHNSLQYRCGIVEVIMNV